jgi:DNA-binding CsgD family transcriptional regulator
VELVGRDTELESIEAWLGAANRQTLLIEGEAGIGKTTLWRAGIELALRRGFRVLSSAPAPSEAQLSFTALRDLLDGHYDEIADQLSSPQRHVLNVTLLRDEPDGAAAEPGSIAVSFLGALRALGSSEPTVVAIDDIQWLDSASAGPIAYAIRRLEPAKVSVLLARRSGELDQGAIVASLGEILDRLRLDPLTVGALGRVLHDRLGTAFPRPTLHRLHEISGGNPFFALELARALEGKATPLRPGDPFPVPGTQRELVRQRLENLPAKTRDALAYASALSRPTIAVVSAALGDDAGVALADAAVADVARDDGGDVRFAHPLFAAAMYELVAPRRRALHGRLAEVVSDAEERARHLAFATKDPDEAVADTIEEGARVAFARGSPEVAGELTEAALRLTPIDDAAEWSRRASDSGWFYFTAGDAARARSLLESASEAAPPGNQRASALLRLATVDHHARDRRAALVVLERITRDPAVDDAAVVAEAHLVIAVSYWVLHEDILRAEEHALKAVALSEHLGDSVILVSSLAALGMIEFTLGRGLPSPPLERALDIEASASDGRVLRQPLQHWAAALVFSDRFDEARPILLEVHDRGVAQGDASVLPWPLMRLAHLELLSGDWARAAAHAEAGLDAARQTGQRPLEADLLCTRALVLAHFGRAEEARAAAEEGLVLATCCGAGIGVRLAEWTLGFLDLSLDSYESAAARLDAVREASTSAGVVDPGENRYLGDLGEALVALGRTTEADELADELEARGRSLDRPGATAVAARVHGLAALERGDVDSAETELRRALDSHAFAPIPFERARTLLALGSAQRRSRQRRAARETLEEARLVFEQLGAALWAEKARAELGRIGGRAPSSGDLTQTEQRVAELVAEGKSNKEVAATLIVSVHTVEATLTSIYRKLDVRSRTEMARALAVRKQ